MGQLYPPNFVPIIIIHKNMWRIFQIIKATLGKKSGEGLVQSDLFTVPMDEQQPLWLSIHLLKTLENKKNCG
jgi:hypothetical protein